MDPFKRIEIDDKDRPGRYVILERPSEESSQVRIVIGSEMATVDGHALAVSAEILNRDL